ncbi:MAG: DEAD/DEAH box helicase family protein, partial [Thermoplasmata archaeon]
MRIEPREYQINVYKNSTDKNTLIVIPTGLGKTIIAAMIIEKYFQAGKKSIFMAPTKPLVMQHFETLKSVLDINDKMIKAFTGEMDNMDREVDWVTGKIFVSTPQVVYNDFKSGIIDIANFDLLIFDEAHRSIGNYAYTDIAREFLQYKKKLIIGLTASPGGNNDKFEEVIKNLGIENVIIKSENDEDVKKYVKDIDIKVIKIPEPQYVASIKKYITDIKDKISDYLNKNGIRSGKSRKDLAGALQDLIDRAKENRSLFSFVRYVTAAIRIDYVLEYLETQGIEIAYNYLREMENSEDSGIKRAMGVLKSNTEYPEMISAFEKAITANEENPKMRKVLEICEEKLSSTDRIIIFTHYRKTSDLLLNYLTKRSEKIRGIRFIGQADKLSDPGLSQDNQRQIIDDFKAGKYNVLIATSIA